MKQTFPILFAAITLLLSIQGAAGNPVREISEEPEMNTITVTGTLRLVGNEPFTRFSLRTKEGESYILEDVVRDEWSGVLGRTVTVKGSLEIRTLTSADKTKTFTEYIILCAELLK